MRSDKKKNKGYKTAKTIVAVLVVGILLFLSLQLYVIAVSNPYMIDSVDKLEKIDKPDVIFVLGAGIYPGGQPSPVLKDRLDHAIEVYEYYDKKIVIVVSGDNKTVEYNETKVMYDYLIQKGIDAQDIYKDYAGFSTYDSIYRADYIFKIQSMIICTQKFHMNRALFLAKKLGITAYGYHAPDKAVYNMPYNNFRESLARVKAVIDADITKRLPKYLGDPIPIKRYD